MTALEIKEALKAVATELDMFMAAKKPKSEILRLYNQLKDLQYQQIQVYLKEAEEKQLAQDEDVILN